MNSAARLIARQRSPEPDRPPCRTREPKRSRGTSLHPDCSVLHPKSRAGVIPKQHFGEFRVQFGQKFAINERKRAEIAPIWLPDVVPAGVLGDQRPSEQSL